MTRLTVIAPVPAVSAAAGDGRTIRGLALPFGDIGRTSAGPVRVAAGAVRVPPDLRTVKLFTEHGRSTPVGYATGATESAAGLSMTFHAGNTPAGDTALLEAAEGIRDALSVELDDVTIDDAGNVTAASLTAVALTSIPAFAAARVVASRSDVDAGTRISDTGTRHITMPAQRGADDQLDDHLDWPERLAGATDDDDGDDAGDDAEDQDDDDAEDGDDDEKRKDEPVTTTTTATAAAPRPPGAAVTRRRRDARAEMSLDAAMSRVVDTLEGSTDANALNAALTDILPSADTSAGVWIKPQWVDELWTPIDARRPYANSVGHGVLTGMKIHGWKWGVRPTVDSYAGNKTPIPSSPATFLPAEATAVRHAGGWDVDNVFVYLGDSSILTAILNAAAQDYAMKQEASIGAAILAEATDAGSADTLASALALLAGTLGATGASPSFVSVSSDLWADWLNMTTADAPWWLSAGGDSPNIVQGTGSAGGLRIWTDPNLPAATILGGDRRAVTFYEPRGNPFRVQAVNLPNGGVDIGVFGFSALLVNDSRGVVTVDVAPVVVP